MTRYSKIPEINRKVKELIAQGWTVTHGGVHWRIRHPNGYSTAVPGSPSDGRSAANWFAQLKRAERDGYRPHYFSIKEHA